MTEQACIEVTEASQIGEARRVAARAARTADMDETKRAEVAIVATELATNLVRYAEHGRLLIQTLTIGSTTVLDLVAVDSGPGIADLSRCFRDGFSSGGTSGTGLGAVRRLSTEFDAHSMPGKGTIVVARIAANRTGAAPRARFAFGAVSLPMPGETVCGDTWRVAERDDEIAVMVADGLGHGPLAAEASTRVADSFTADPFADADAFFQRAHRAAHGSRGAAVACSTISRSGEVHFAGVGNIAGMLVAPETCRGLPSQNGTVGVEMRNVKVFPPYRWPDRGFLILHSDGLTSRCTLDPYPGLLVRHPAVVAAVLYRDFLRGRDDATVVVIGPAPAGSAS